MQKILLLFSINEYDYFDFSYNDIGQIHIKPFIERISNINNFEIQFHFEETYIDKRMKQKMHKRMQEFIMKSFSK